MSIPPLTEPLTALHNGPLQEAWGWFQSRQTEILGQPLHPEQPVETGACVFTSWLVLEALHNSGRHAEGWGGFWKGQAVCANTQTTTRWHAHSVVVVDDQWFVDLTGGQFGEPMRVVPLQDVAIHIPTASAWKHHRFPDDARFVTQKKGLSPVRHLPLARRFQKEHPHWLSEFRENLLCALDAA